MKTKYVVKNIWLAFFVNLVKFHEQKVNFRG
jgi:hypothetical protein